MKFRAQLLFLGSMYKGARLRKKITVGMSGVLLASGLTACDMASETVRIFANEFRFAPREIHLQAYQPVSLIVTNQGRERHHFQSTIFTNPGVQVSTEAPRNVLNERGGNTGIILNPGQSVSLTIAAPPGQYRFRCPIRGHRGMEGLLIVEEAGGTFSGSV